jgi:hypothetical protein
VKVQVLDQLPYKTNLIILWSRVVLEELIFAQLVKKFPPPFMEPKVLFSCSRELATGPYPERINSIPHIEQQIKL